MGSLSRRGTACFFTAALLVFSYSDTTSAIDVADAQYVVIDGEHYLEDTESLGVKTMKVVFFPVTAVLVDVETVGEEVVYFSRHPTVHWWNFLKPKLKYPWRVWHYPVDVVITSPYWIGHGISEVGRKLSAHNVVRDRNLFTGAASMLAEVLLVFDAAQVPVEWTGIVVRDFARLLLLKPFNINEHISTVPQDQIHSKYWK